MIRIIIISGMLISIIKWKAAKRSEIECGILDEAF